MNYYVNLKTPTTLAVGAGKIIGKIGYNWECYDRRATFNEGMLKLHRYLSIMANKKLRKKYFKF